ncbi:hypothetical protein SADUNF_Sadunf10G0131700 [Salix dunnii]|uniref:RING-type domain-containing protein n=1 Tax=Salix dunnii TaxID=1413687 RepID=A0A835MV09_9ROSI|nr:hypothetical protein SADUNF_Sadunf10G0131700 [Salix dunnii]
MTNLQACSSTIFKIISSLLILLSYPTIVSCERTCEVDQDLQRDDQGEALKYKLGSILSVLVAGAIGVGLPLLGKKIKALSPENDIFFMIKAYAAGVILATGFIHILPDAFDSLTSPCLAQNPWGSFPFTAHRSASPKEDLALSGLIRRRIVSQLFTENILDSMLRDRLVKIITDYITETSLRHGCNDILKVKYYIEARRAICLSNEEEDARATRDGSRDSQAVGRIASARTMEVKSKTRGDTRCCMCFDPFSIRDVSVVPLFCCHAYHMSCLMDSMHTVSGRKGSGATSGMSEYDSSDKDDENEETVLELGIVVHSVIIGISLGASSSPRTIKPLMAALPFQQIFEGMGLGGCITLVYNCSIYIPHNLVKKLCHIKLLFMATKPVNGKLPHGFWARHGEVKLSNASGSMWMNPVARITPAAYALIMKKISFSGLKAFIFLPSRGRPTPIAPATRTESIEPSLYFSASPLSSRCKS